MEDLSVYDPIPTDEVKEDLKEYKRILRFSNHNKYMLTILSPEDKTYLNKVEKTIKECQTEINFLKTILEYRGINV